MKFISWNVNGLRACATKGFADIFTELDADFFCLQETKMQAGQLDLAFPGYHSYWNYAEKKGYSGTAIYTKHAPLNVYYGMGSVEADGTIIYKEDNIHNHEGRIITLEYEDYYVITVYVPNAQDELRRLEYRMEWEDAFLSYIKALDKKKPVIYCGDLNVAHEEIDLKNPKTNHKNPGFTDEERGKFSDVLAAGFKDTFRELHPEEQTFSWWSYRFHAREKNVGWRIDYFIVSERLMPMVKSAAIHTEIFGSDHCPVELVFNA
ncbi:MAG: exodeoxyribonuclease III [Prevotella sp.]|nr:exodeoxyribonuclease III [Candidatus Prevotella equi]